MTVRKPPGVGWDSWIEQKIREGQQEGMFDNLSGTGRPLAGIDEPHDEDWWIKEKLKREEISYLPPTLAIRKDVEDARAAIARARTEQHVREILTEINLRIREINSKATAGPPSTVMPLDVERTVAEWHATRPAPSASDGAPSAGITTQPASPPRRRWWHRWRQP